jgi:stage II sporulation protein M
MEKLRQIKIYLKITTSFFLLAILSGIFITYLSSEYSRDLLDVFSQKLFLFENLKKTPLFILIFFNNAAIALLMILSGFFFALFPIFLLFSNGEILGIVLGVTYGNIGFLTLISSLLPHGIFEFPAIILSAALGLRLGVKFFLFLVKKDIFLIYLKESLIIYVELIMPLLLLAAIIETLLFEIVKF